MAEGWQDSGGARLPPRKLEGRARGLEFATSNAANDMREEHSRIIMERLRRLLGKPEVKEEESRPAFVRIRKVLEKED